MLPHFENISSRSYFLMLGGKPETYTLGSPEVSCGSERRGGERFLGDYSLAGDLLWRVILGELLLLLLTLRLGIG